MAYGDKRDYPKIDIYRCGRYVASTTWARTCREAKIRYLMTNPHENPSDIRTRFA